MNDYLVNSEFYKKLFPEDPSFSAMIFHALSISGNDFYVTFDLPNIFPEKAPRQWISSNANSIRLVFTFIQSKNIRINDLTTEKTCSLKITRIENETYKVSFTGAAGNLSLDCSFISIGGVIPYGPS